MIKKTIIFLLFLFFLFSPDKVFAVDVVINEFLANQTSGEDEWVEFYNTGGVNLQDYWIDDDIDFNSDSGNTSKKKIGTGVSLDVTNATYPFITLSSSMFNDTCSGSCDYIALFDPDGILVDSYQYTESQISEEGKTIGRLPDGSGSWFIFSQTSKGASNDTTTPVFSPTPTSTDPSPTNSPTPTKGPTPTKSPTPTKKLTPTPTKKLQEKNANTDDLFVAGETKIALDKSPTPQPSPQVLGEKTSRQPFIFIGLGTIFIAVCGILAYFQFGDKISIWKKKSL